MKQGTWYLGVDFGIKGVTAVLLRGESRETYPIYWSSPGSESPDFRLPTAVYYGMGATPSQSPFLLGHDALQRKSHPQGIFCEQFQPYLQVSLPYYSSYTHQWEPQIQGDEHSLSLYWIQRACQGLFNRLTPPQVEEQYTVGAVNCSPETVSTALSHLEGVFLNYPLGWKDPYQFNLREAVLGAKLVQHPSQIFFVDEAIASLLAVYSSPREATPPLKPGLTLVIHLGELSTELALVKMPESFEKLTREHFYLHHIPYGGSSIDQDIFAQMLYPQWINHQPILELLEGILPQPGAIETEKRSHLQSFFQASAARRSLGSISPLVRQLLSEQKEFSSQLHHHPWTVKKRDLEIKVISPAIETLNQHLNQFLLDSQQMEQGITQVVCSGETLLSLWWSLKKWLQSKLGSATFIFPDSTYPFNHLATGLAHIPLFPQVLDMSYHQYSDYFLLSELLKLSWSQPLPLKEIFNLLEHRGINTQVCHHRIQKILAGELPEGLVPDPQMSLYLCESSQDQRIYQDLKAMALFSQSETGAYQRDSVQQEIMSQYLATVLSGTVQKFDEPYVPPPHV